MFLEIYSKIFASEEFETSVFHNSIPPIETVLASQAVCEHLQAFSLLQHSRPRVLFDDVLKSPQTQYTRVEDDLPRPCKHVALRPRAIRQKRCWIFRTAGDALSFDVSRKPG